MMLELLEGLEGRKSWIHVIQPDYVSHIDLVVRQVIDEAAAIGGVVQRPPHRVLNHRLACLALRAAATVP